MRYDNILGVIGDTPLVGVHALSPTNVWAESTAGSCHTVMA